MDYDYPQRWLRDISANASKLGWFKSKTFEILKSQKNLVGEEIQTDTVFFVIPDTLNCNDKIPVELKYLPRVANQLDYTLNISNENICTFNEDTKHLEFLGVPGTVTISITMKDGDASFVKEVTVLKDIDYIEIAEGNIFEQEVTHDITLNLIPNDTTEKVLDVFVWNTTDIEITEKELLNSFTIHSKKAGNYDLIVITDKGRYKLPIYFVSNSNQIVDEVIFDNIKNYYQFNELIYLTPELNPQTASFKSYTVTIDDPNIATWNSGKNAILTKNVNGSTNVTIKMNYGTAKYNFELVVLDESSFIPVDDISISNLPEYIIEKNEMELKLNVLPDGANASDINITSTPEAIITKTNDKWFIRGVSVGVATITVESALYNISKTYTIEVTPLLVSAINLSEIPLTSLIGATIPFDVTVDPSNATDKSYTVSTSSNLNLVKISENNYTVKSTALGEAWVKVAANDSSNIEVTKSITIQPILATSINLNNIPTDMVVGDTNDFTISILPANTTDKTFTITTSQNLTSTKSGNVYSISATASGAGWIKAVANDASKVEVIKNISITDPIILVNALSLDVPEEVTVGDTLDVSNVIVSPSNANDKTYKVSIASGPATLSGMTVTFGPEAGLVEISITANDSSKTNIIKSINVVEPEPVPEPDPEPETPIE